MNVYQPGQNGDAELLAWYLRLVQDGELANLFGKLLQPLGLFMRNFTDEEMNLCYEADDQGWWIVGWARPFMGGASWGLWVRPDKRDSAEAVEFTLKLHELAFEHFGLLVLATHQDKVVASMKRMGYTEIGAVPHLFGAELAGQLMYLTRRDFEATKSLWKDRANGRSSR